MSITNLYKYTLFSLPLLLLLIPFCTFPHIQSPYEFPKFVITLSVIQLFIFIRALFCLETKTPFIGFDKLSITVIVFLCILFIADLFGRDLHTSFFGNPYRFQGFLLWIALGIFFLVIHALQKNEKEELFASYMKYTPWFLLLFCSIGISDGVRFFFFHDYSVATQNARIVTSFGNPNFLAAYVVVLLPIALSGINMHKHLTNTIRYLMQGILSSAVLFIILFTDSKSALLAVSALILIFLLRFRSLLKAPTCIRYSRYKKLIQNITVLCLFVLSLIVLISFIDTLRFSPWDNRGLIWSYGIESVIKHPFLGIGQENYQLTLHDVRFFSVDSAHNLFLEIGVAAGIPMFALFCSIVFFVYKQSTYQIRLSLVAFCICAFFNPVSIAALTLFWFLLAL